MSVNNIEIERKFLVKEIPGHLDNYSSHEIKQGYISTNPTIRLRQQDNDYIFTFKGIGIMEKVEFEHPLTLAQFHNLWKKVENRTITKTRYIIPIENNLKAELDIYTGDLSGFMNVEVEFSTTEDANNFIPPDWFGVEITADKRYSNASLSIFGIPPK